MAILAHPNYRDSMPEFGSNGQADRRTALFRDEMLIPICFHT